MPGPTFEPTDRTRVKRLPPRGVYDRQTIYAILDEALVCHVGIVTDGQPYVIPMLHARVDDHLYLHGSPGSRLIQSISRGEPACITATLLDGLVMTRSAFHHSVNYRSVVMLGRGELISEREHKWNVLHQLVERIIPGRWKEIRHPNDNEFNGTAVIGFPIEECSAKIRTGPPKDEPTDAHLPVWAGVLPLALRSGTPIPDPNLRPGIPTPDYVLRYGRAPASAMP